MKALTLWQPWASLIAIGAKTIETRSWSTAYRGPLAIHAATRNALRSTEWSVEMSRALDGRFLQPLGAVVATCTLVDVVPMGDTADDGDEFPRLLIVPGRPPLFRSSAPYPSLVLFRDPMEQGEDVSGQRPYGDFAPGRYAWLLDDIQPITPPSQAKGHQGLWEWEGVLYSAIRAAAKVHAAAEALGVEP